MQGQCCDSPTQAGPGPTKGEDKIRVICGSCGHDHGEMTPEKAAELFKQLSGE